MAVIDAKKLLPPSKKSGAIEKQKVLVPLKNISSKKISAGDLKPADKESKTSEDLSIIKSKVIQIDVLLRNSYIIDKRNAEARRKEEERKRSEKREKNIESKVKKNQVSTNLISSIPGQSIFDKINRFIGFTILGYLFNQYGKLLPKLLEFGKIIEPVGKFVEDFAKNLLKGAVDFVEFGYKAYDQTRDFVKQIGGEGAQKTFDEFSKNLNLILNGAIAASMLIISTAPKKPRGGKPGPGRSGGMPGGKPSSIPKNTKLASYLDRDPQTKLIEKRYGNDAAKMYEARKAQGASVSRARADVLKRFEKFEGTQRGLGGGTGRGSILSRGIGKSANRTALKVLGKTGTRIARGVFGRIPILGGLIDFAFSLAMGENPGRAAAKAVGATVGSALGTFIPIPFAGTILGGILGDIVGGALYDTLVGGNKKPVQARAEGGTISKPGQSTVAPSRRLKTKPRKISPKIQPQRTQPGRDVGGKQRIEGLYGKDKPGERSALRALKKSSEDIKKIRSINGLTGAMFGAGIDMTLGQKPDKKLAKSIGDVFGSVVQNAVNAELNNSFGDISKTIAMANGGVVPPTREIGRSLSIGERIGKFISTALAVSIESSATKILQNLNRELILEKEDTGEDGGPTGGDSDGGGGGGGGTLPGDAPPEVKALLEAISSGEGGWNSVNSGLTIKGLTDMTISQARETGMRIRREGKGSGALGKWQQMPVINGVNTLKERTQLAGLNYEKDKFSPENQTKITRAYLASVYGGEAKLVKDLQKDPMIAVRKLNGVWPSLPGGSQQNTTEKKFKENFAKAIERYGSTDSVSQTGLVNPTPRTNLKTQKGGYAADSGLDIQGKIGDPIVSPVSGILEYAEAGHTRQANQDSDPNTPGFQPQYSFRIKLDKPFKFKGKTVNFVYGTHLSSLSSSVANKSGIKIRQGQLLGKMGQANGVPHLHLGLVGDRNQTEFLNFKEVDEALGGRFASKSTSRPPGSGSALGRVLSSTNINGATYTAREGGKYYKNGKEITKAEYDKAFGLRASLAPNPDLKLASGLNVPSYERVETTTFVLQKVVETIA